jgi:hypothetical protein
MSESEGKPRPNSDEAPFGSALVLTLRQQGIKIDLENQIVL